MESTPIVFSGDEGCPSYEEAFGNDAKEQAAFINSASSNRIYPGPDEGLSTDSALPSSVMDPRDIGEDAAPIGPVFDTESDLLHEDTGDNFGDLIRGTIHGDT